MENQNDFIKDLKSTIIERLDNHRGGSYYGCDLAYTLFEGENVDGSVLYNTWRTKEFIKANFDLFGLLIKHTDTEMGLTLNPFLEPEKAHVCLLLEASRSLLSKTPMVSENWNEKIELTNGVIQTLTDEINELSINVDSLF